MGQKKMQTEPQAPGRKFLKVTGFLYILHGGFMALGIILILLFHPEPGDIVFMVLLFPQMLYSVLVGVMGVLYCNYVERAGMLRTLAVVDMGLVAGLSLYHLMVASTTLPNPVTNLIFPILFMIGVVKNLRSKKSV
ncbi:MAG: hypothetical protein FWE28_03470 [Oscillospiraceae bacterium]|nr:hypothetical protein [Oscillospiraceae bacterium]